MMNSPTDFAYYMTKYLSDYLPGTSGASRNTILSYRDTFKLFLSFVSDTKNLKPEKITLDILSRDIVLEYLNWIERERGCSVQTRNQRLTAFRAFFRFIQTKEPMFMLKCQEILSIRKKKTGQGTVSFLSVEGINLLLCQPDPTSASGMKHQVMLAFMYATACRVQEIVDATVMDFKFNGNNLVRLTGKGEKSRFVPLEMQVTKLVDRYLDERRKDNLFDVKAPLFTNHSGNKLTRQGVTAILKKYVDAARKERSELIPEKFSPHGLRHSRAVHWLQSGIDLIYIRDLLGHVSVQTTEVYAKIDGKMKKKALEKASPIIYTEGLPVWQSDQSMMNWLKSF
jgi:site-specific recombinase XerD